MCVPNAGGSAYSDVLGDPWGADRAYSAGSWGYVQKSKTASTSKPIAGTTDPTLYKTQRIDPYAYRYDNVPNGVYQLDFRFAELLGAKVGKRLFDVIVENTLVLPAYDIRYEVGLLAADTRTFFVEVTDGRMDVRFVPPAGYEDCKLEFARTGRTIISRQHRRPCPHLPSKCPKGRMRRRLRSPQAGACGPAGGAGRTAPAVPAS